uniref:Uncharacterized protein n=1 Tax=Parascaris equorum TaxID=6256 RepID=A0A914R5J7_PAREQ
MKGTVKKCNKDFSKSPELEYSWRLSKLSTIVPTAFAMKFGNHGHLNIFSLKIEFFVGLYSHI